MKILCFDPGGRSGWCLLSGGNMVGGSFHLWFEIDTLIEKHTPTVVVAESFRLWPHMAQKLSFSTFPACRVIGVIEFVCARKNIPLTMQQPSQRINIKLVRLEGFDKHAHDAARHAIRYAQSIGLSDYDRFLANIRPKNTYSRTDGLEKSV